MASHRLRRRTDRLTLAMAAITTLVLGAGVWGVAHLHDSPAPSSRDVCHAIPGTSRLDCG